MTGQMTGSVAIVTGSGRGIGRAIAKAYAAEGAHVVLASRTQASVAAVAEQIRGAGGSARAVACDVGNREDITATVAYTVERFGTVHVLVNNAQGFGTAAAPATSTVYTGVEDVDADHIEYSFRTGALASLWGMQAVFGFMKAQGWGKIVNFSSTSGLLGTTGNAPYNMTKEAVRALTRTASTASLSTSSARRCAPTPSRRGRSTGRSSCASCESRCRCAGSARPNATSDRSPCSWPPARRTT